jgi:hypothetical protein
MLHAGSDLADHQGHADHVAGPAATATIVTAVLMADL